MNKLLAKYGYIDGAPGGWVITAKGALFGTEEHYMLGPGGYAMVHTVSRHWDERVLEELAKDMAAPVARAAAAVPAAASASRVALMTPGRARVGVGVAAVVVVGAVAGRPAWRWARSTALPRATHTFRSITGRADPNDARDEAPLTALPGSPAK